MSAKETLHKFLDSVTDLTSLEVTTYTGKLSQVIDAGTGKLQWDAFRPDGALVLVAATLIASAVALNGHANWLEGLELLSIYVIAALVFWYL